jgi:hypothetical protein
MARCGALARGIEPDSPAMLIQADAAVGPFEGRGVEILVGKS